MDRIIKPESDNGGASIRSHQFASIDQLKPDKQGSLMGASCKSFESGLLKKRSACPTLAQIGSGQAVGHAQGMLNNNEQIPQTHAEATHDTSENTVACIWERFDEAVQNFDQEKNDMFERVAQEIVKLAMAIAEKIMHHQVTIDSELIMNIVRHALKKAKQSSQVRIRIHPEDLKVMQHTDGDTDNAERILDGVVFEPDALLQRGDCLVETPELNFDATMKNQLDVIEKEFAALFKENGSKTLSAQVIAT